MEGWISLYRKFVNWEWYTDANTMRVFLHLLLLANHKENKWRGILIERGQLVTSYNSLSDDLNLTVQEIRTSFKRLKSTNEITTKPTNKYTFVTILKYNDYQDNQKENNKQTNTRNNNQTTSN